MAKKVTIGLAVHWQCITDYVVSHLRAKWLGKGEKHSTITQVKVR